MQIEFHGPLTVVLEMNDSERVQELQAQIEVLKAEISPLRLQHEHYREQSIQYVNVCSRLNLARKLLISRGVDIARYGL